MPRLIVLQPGYLPWLGFFDQMAKSDVFVYYDDVQFDKHGWRNRNRIKGPQGPVWLTVPVLHKGRMGQSIVDVEIDNTVNWGRKHIESTRQFYSRAPFTKTYLPQLEELLGRTWSHLWELDLAVVELFCGWMGLSRPVYRSSQLGIGGERNERLLALCQHFGADQYLSGSAARCYLDEALFERHGIAVQWHDYVHPVYTQQNGPFEPYLSVLDLLLNCGGADALSIIQAGSPSGNDH